ncbi:hypothetical protein FHS94_003892 [Sphingomonas aerophila]|uniref:Uncharacterized protein n=1 Tax=Sphingomonas aerophila TaxID=1344948 RepID=A0A7W9BH29_9SPHN|nr:hypothetical protein [Sphingomonas aerophila]MBB5717018.1 hypothetical protein [Sphingomonas aerophila]
MLGGCKAEEECRFGDALGSGIRKHHRPLFKHSLNDRAVEHDLDLGMPSIDPDAVHRFSDGLGLAFKNLGEARSI